MEIDVAPKDDDLAGDLMLQLLTRISWSLEDGRADTFTYVIGNNGTGKSHLLAALADQLSYSELGPNVVCISNSLYDRFKLKGPATYQYLGARSVTNAIFKTSLDRLLFQQILVAMHKNKDRLNVLIDALGLEFDFVVVRYRSFSSATGKPRVDQDRVPIPPLSPVHAAEIESLLGKKLSFDALMPQQIGALLNLVPLKPTIEVSVRARRGKQVEFSMLSTGEQNRILLLAKVVAAIDAKTVLFIDEPEISLHLHWQMNFHPTLKGLLEGFPNVHVVVATHAPILISEAAKADPNSESDAVVIMKSIAPLGVLSSETSMPMVPLRYAMHSFAEVASHDQLVLRYFQTAPYQGREVSIEVAQALLDVAEGQATEDSLRTLQALQDAEGLVSQDRQHIDEAVKLIKGGIVTSLTRDFERDAALAGVPDRA